jgi:plastocyanin
MRAGRVLTVLAAAALSAACGGSSDGGMTSTTAPASDGGVTSSGTDGGTASALALHLQGFAFSPETMTVPAGATVEVFNDDGSTPHSVTSEATAGSYTPGAVGGVSFDTGIFTGTKSFTIPASAPQGTVVPFYCRVHGPMMVDATKVEITIGAASAPASPTPPPSPAPPSGY